MTIVGPDFDCIQATVFRTLLDSPECAPRGQRVKERLGVTLRLTNPRARLTAAPARAANYRFATGEFLWYLRGAEDLESIAYYNPRMREFSDDGKTLESAYGKRLRSISSWSLGRGETLPLIEGRSSQWNEIIDELVRDPDSRRAVMTIYGPWDLRRAGVGTKDVPCTLALQFFIRHREGTGHKAAPGLHLHVTMRSNDAVWGLTNDLFSFTLLQEAMLIDLRARGLDIELGEYVHTAGSLHLYERHFELAAKVLSEREGGFFKDAEPMPPIAQAGDLEVLLFDEAVLREGCGDFARYVNKYGGGAEWMLKQLVEHRQLHLEKAGTKESP